MRGTSGPPSLGAAVSQWVEAVMALVVAFFTTLLSTEATETYKQGGRPRFGAQPAGAGSYPRPGGPRGGGGGGGGGGARPPSAGGPRIHGMNHNLPSAGGS